MKLLLSLKRIILVTTLTVTPFFAFADGGTAPGGGSLTEKNGSYTLADLHFKPTVGKMYIINDDLKSQLNWIKDTLLAGWGLGGQYKPRGKEKINADAELQKFFKEHVLGENVVFKLVKELPCKDKLPVEDENLNVHQFACTQGWYTYIVPELFAKLSLVEKAAAIIHERLHSWAPTQPHDVISPFINGLVFLGKNYPLLAKKSLAENEIEMLSLFRFTAMQLGFRNYYPNYKIFANGGGLVSKLENGLQIDPTAWVSFHSSVGVSEENNDSTYSVGKNVQIIDSHVLNGNVGNNVRIVKSAVNGSSVPDGMNVIDVSLNSVTLSGSNIDIRNSNLNAVEIGESVKIVNSQVGAVNAKTRTALNDVEINNSLITPKSTLSIGRRVRISATKITTGEEIIILDNAEFKNSEVNLKYNSEILFGKNFTIQESTLKIDPPLSKIKIIMSENSEIINSQLIFDTSQKVLTFPIQTRIVNSVFNVSNEPHGASAEFSLDSLNLENTNIRVQNVNPLASWSLHVFLEGSVNLKNCNLDIKDSELSKGWDRLKIHNTCQTEVLKWHERTLSTK